MNNVFVLPTRGLLVEQTLYAGCINYLAYPRFVKYTLWCTYEYMLVCQANYQGIGILKNFIKEEICPVNIIVIEWWYMEYVYDNMKQYLNGNDCTLKLLQ